MADAQDDGTMVDAPLDMEEGQASEEPRYDTNDGTAVRLYLSTTPDSPTLSPPHPPFLTTHN